MVNKPQLRSSTVSHKRQPISTAKLKITYTPKLIKPQPKQILQRYSPQNVWDLQSVDSTCALQLKWSRKPDQIFSIGKRSRIFARHGKKRACGSKDCANPLDLNSKLKKNWKAKAPGIVSEIVALAPKSPEHAIACMKNSSSNSAPGLLKQCNASARQDHKSSLGLARCNYSNPLHVGDQRAWNSSVDGMDVLVNDISTSYPKQGILALKYLLQLSDYLILKAGDDSREIAMNLRKACSDIAKMMRAGKTTEYSHEEGFAEHHEKTNLDVLALASILQD